MSARGESANLGIYSAPEVVAHYADLGYLTPCEQLLFDTYLHPGMNILDLGVGGGRTTPYLSAIASRYFGGDDSNLPQQVSSSAIRDCGRLWSFAI